TGGLTPRRSRIPNSQRRFIAIRRSRFRLGQRCGTTPAFYSTIHYPLSLSTPRVVRRVIDSRLAEPLLPLVALSAPAAVSAVGRADARERQFERQAGTATQHVGLVQVGIRADDAGRAADGAIHHGREVAEELGRRVREWVRGQRGH